MPCTVQQGAHICLVSPSNIDNQHACEIKNQMSFILCNYDKIKITQKKKTNKEYFTVRFLCNRVDYVRKTSIMAAASVC